MIYLYSQLSGHEESVTGPTVDKITQVLNTLYSSVDVEQDQIIISNDKELTLEIYLNSVVLQDYGQHIFDGPGGPGELFRTRTNVSHVAANIQTLISLLDSDSRPELIDLLATLPRLA